MLSRIPVVALMWLFTIPCAFALTAGWQLTKRDAREDRWSYQFYRRALFASLVIIVLLFWVIAARLAGPTAWE